MNVLNIYIIANIIAAFVLVVATILILIFAPNKLNRECALRHNHYRHFHESPFLSVSRDLVKYAENRAQVLKSTDVFAHSSDGRFGENLYKVMFSEDKADALDTFECDTALKLWYDEIEDYDFESGKSKNGKMIGHFTQMVWKDTKNIGCAKSYSSKSKTMYLVCNYDPPGNWGGRYIENVPVPIH